MMMIGRWANPTPFFFFNICILYIYISLSLSLPLEMLDHLSRSLPFRTLPCCNGILLSAGILERWILVGWPQNVVLALIKNMFELSFWCEEHPIWRFPEMWVALVIIHFRWGFSLINHPFLGGTPMTMEIPYLSEVGPPVRAWPPG